MFPYLMISLVFLAPVNQTIKFTEALTLEVPYLKKRTRAPFAGFLISKAKVAQLFTEITSADEFCETRRRNDAEQAAIDLLRVQNDFASRTKGYLLRIGDLELLNQKLSTNLKGVRGELEAEKNEYQLFRYVSYGMGATLLGVVTYLVIAK